MQKSFPVVETLIQELLASSTYGAMSVKDKEETADTLRGHVERLILETFLNRLDDEKVKELRGLMNDSEKMEEKFTEYAALIPGLAEDIEERVKREFQVLKAIS
jgi:hypothetical protein